MEEMEITIKLKVKTNKSFDLVGKAIKKAIYIGLDSTPYYIAQPSDVEIISITVK